MNTAETSAFIAGYGPASRDRICFAWNQKHAGDFRDDNASVRQEVIAAVLAEPGKTDLDLIADLFEAEARWSKEAWCVRDSFSTIGTLLLRRGGIAQLDRFLEWFAVSFDSYSQCHAMSLDPVTLAPLISEVERRLAAGSNDRWKARLEMARDLFAKHKSGNPLKGMVKLGPSELRKAKVSVHGENWFDRLKKAYKKMIWRTRRWSSSRCARHYYGH
jgi:hypothetical protein